ncbi:hypothetical protein ACSAZL_02130 [Methanosarcina sp. T3]|uniref:hypothetical protein n=1 Tax=Methanosarcina sp. T3 TaxID=3439062 RepID=UPI003F82C2AD
MEDEKNTLPEKGPSKKEKESSEKDKQEDDEDLLYTHKPESRGNEMRWNTTLCRKPGR